MKTLSLAKVLFGIVGLLLFVDLHAQDLTGLWKAQQWFGPSARGPLLIERTKAGWTADFVGRSLAVESRGSELHFALPDDAGKFDGHLDGNRITGQWTTPPSRTSGFRYASPVTLTSAGADRWRGVVTPRDDTYTLFLMVQQQPDGTLGAYLRNPDRNDGVFSDVTHIARDGKSVRLMGHRRGQKTEEALFEGSYDSESDLLSIANPYRGGTYDFRRDGDSSDFYPRGKTPQRYVYRAPPARADGWTTGTLEQVQIDRPAIEKFVQMLIEMPMESVHTPQVHGVLIARHGKLVFEEYFHGEHRDRLHDTRSAAKSLTATLIGAAMHAHAPLQLSTPVYAAMNGGKLPADLDPQKRSMTLEHLLMMRSGYFCDDSNPDAPGNEDTMHEQTEEPDYYRFTLRLPLDREPGAKGVYCSIDPNLALGMLNRATGESLLDLHDRLLGEPLQFGTYGWPINRAGQPYGGGGMYVLPRDFMKLGQVMLDGGVWHGKRILDADFAKRAGSPLHELNRIQYGYLWWNIEYPYKDRKLRAYFAGGNGGQLVMVVPELDLVIATYGANYADRVSLVLQQEYVPQYILPAVREAGDDPTRPVQTQNFKTPYGRPPAQ
ncbi:MAG TPA: serine hydrolase [Steroidobacteraceae bacterium]|nr:serine hydrolase [Steroidobacteraceae bacterium]